MKKYSIRLYRMHDMDLLSLIGTTEFNFTKAAYCILKAYVNNEAFIVDIPRDRDVVIPKYERRYQKNLYLDESKDADIIALLDSLTPGYRCNFIKNVMRLYIAFPLSVEFLNVPSQITEFHKKNGIFRVNRKIADAASLKRSQFALKDIPQENNCENIQTDNKSKVKEEKINKESAVNKKEKKRNDFVFEETEKEKVIENEPNKTEDLLSEDESEDLLKALMSMK